jgi:hypothetical protein
LAEIDGVMLSRQSVDLDEDGCPESGYAPCHGCHSLGMGMWGQAFSILANSYLTVLDHVSQGFGFLVSVKTYPGSTVWKPIGKL